MRLVVSSLLLALFSSGLFGAEDQLRRLTGDDRVREASGGTRQATEIFNNTTISFALPIITRATLFLGDYGYFVRVPAGATELRLRLVTTSDIELYARLGLEASIASNGTVLADHSTELIASKDLRITLSSQPPLREGTYYIALAAFNIQDPNTGTISVSITGGNTGGGGQLSVALGQLNQQGCPSTLRLPVIVRDSTGSLVSGLSDANFTLLENFATKTKTTSCSGPGTCELTWAPTSPNSPSGIEVRVQTGSGSTLRTGSANATLPACPTGGGGGGGGTTGRTAIGVKLEGGALAGSTFATNAQIWSTLPDGNWALGFSQPDASAPLLNAANKSVSLPQGTYFMYLQDTQMGSHVRLTVQWNDNSTSVAVFEVGSVSSAATWARVSGATDLAIVSTGITNLDKVSGSTSISAGNGFDIVLRATLGTASSGGGGGGGGSTGSRNIVQMQLLGGSFTSTFNGNGAQWNTAQDASWTLGVSMPDASSPLLNAANKAINIPLSTGGILATAVYPDWSGRITGTVNGNQLTGNYTDSANSGTVSFQLAADTMTFSGSFTRSNGATSPWNGTRTGTNTGTFAGQWSTSYGPMTITLGGSASGASFFLYAEPSANGSHVQLNIAYSDGTTETAAFTFGSLTSASTWTRVSGSSNVSLGSAGITANRVAGNAGVTAGGSNDMVFRLDLAGGSGSGGGGGGGGGTGPIGVTITSENNASCPTTKRVVVSVVDSTGSAVTGLNSSNFRLTENGQQRTVTAVCSTSGGGSGSITAAAVAIVIDASGSLSGSDLVNEKNAAIGLVNSLGANDMIAVYSFDSTVSQKTNFTSNKQAAIAAINSISSGGSTALYQAIVTAAQALGGQSGRRVLVLMTDGENNISGKTIDDAIAAAKAASAPVYAVGFGSGINTTVLQRLGTETSGAFTRGASSSELQALLQRVASTITNSCELAYPPADPTREADVTVTVTIGSQTGSGSRRVAACTGGGGGGTGGPGTITTPGCNYFVTPLSNSVTARETTGLIRMTCADNCEWGAHSEVGWIRVVTVRNNNGKGSGGVDYLVSQNTTSSSRTGRILVAGQAHSVTQAAGESCTLTISPSSATGYAAGGSGTIIVNSTGASCAWTAASNDSWLKVTVSSGTGPGRVPYTYDRNSSTNGRAGTVTVAGQTFTLRQDAGAAPGTPVVPESGIVNSASGIPPSLPGGALAQGSFFTVFATDVGPSPAQQVERFPLPTNLGGTSVQIRQGSQTVDCLLVYTSTTQINGIIPSNAPIGDAEMIVSYQGRASRPAKVRIARHNFGIFATSQGRGPGIIQNFVSQLDQPLNTRSNTAKPRQVIILWGTGAGPIAAPDNVAPPAGNLPFAFEMQIGGKPATLLYNGRAPCCSGVDQIVAEVPPDAPTGCFVPVKVRAGDSWSNVVTMAIDANGRTCSDAANPTSSFTSTGGKIGMVMLTRLQATVNSATQGPQTLNADLGIAAFSQLQASGDLGFDMLTSMPPVGSCQAYAGVRDLSDLLGGAVGGPLQGYSNTKMLDAGATIQISSGGRSGKLDKSSNGLYQGVLGGSLPIGSGSSNMTLDPGAYTITGSGGAEVGAFNATINLRQGVTWTNRDRITIIDRKAPLQFTWSGGTAGEQVLLLGYGTDQKVKASSGFLCVAPADAGSFTVPTSALSNLPAVPATADLSDQVGLLGIFSFRSGILNPFTASGIDAGLLLGTQIEAKTVGVQ